MDFEMCEDEDEDEEPFYCPYMKNFPCNGCFTDWLMDDVPYCFKMGLFD